MPVTTSRDDDVLSGKAIDDALQLRKKHMRGNRRLRDGEVFAREITRHSKHTFLKACTGVKSRERHLTNLAQLHCGQLTLIGLSQAPDLDNRRQLPWRQDQPRHARPIDCHAIADCLDVSLDPRKSDFEITPLGERVDVEPLWPWRRGSTSRLVRNDFEWHAEDLRHFFSEEPFIGHIIRSAT